jgi:hypothetical protein
VIWIFFDDVTSRLIRIGGLIGVGWETLAAHIDRPYLLFLFACMMGISRWDAISSVIVPKGNNE